MLKYLRRALEDEKPDVRPVVISGPLSEALTQALNTEYAKPEQGEDGNLATESQALDDHAMRQLADMLAPAEAETTDAIRVYGVSEADISDDDIVQITQELADTPTDQREDFVVVLDGTNPEAEQGGEPDVKIVALECLMKAYGCKVYPSLEAFAEARYG